MCKGDLSKRSGPRGSHPRTHAAGHGRRWDADNVDKASRALASKVRILRCASPSGWPSLPSGVHRRRGRRMELELGPAVTCRMRALCSEILGLRASSPIILCESRNPIRCMFLKIRQRLSSRNILAPRRDLCNAKGVGAAARIASITIDNTQPTVGRVVCVTLT